MTMDKQNTPIPRDDGGPFHPQIARSGDLAISEGVPPGLLHAGLVREQITEQTRLSAELEAARTRIAELEALTREQDAMLGRRPCQDKRCMDMAAARALLAEVLAADDEDGIADTNGPGWPILDKDFAEVVGRIRAFMKGNPAPASTIPDGWALLSADFSIIANGGSNPGSVTLIRTGTDRKNWHAYADADEVPLYAYGGGMNYDEALRSAINQASAAPPVPKGGA